MAGKSDSEVAVSTASSAGLYGRSVVSTGSQRLSPGSLFHINLTDLERKEERPSPPLTFLRERPHWTSHFPGGCKKGVN